jgi:signal transduction histidine kinase
VRDALEQVRSISHGVFPPAVADGGLACALEELSFALPDVVIDVRVGDVALSPVIEATAYLIAARCSEEAAASRVTVDVDADRLRLTVAFTTDHDPGSMVDLESRALALGGTWSTSARRVDVELPCAS